MKQFVPFVVLYFIIDFIKALRSVEGPFQPVHWLMVVMLAAFFVLLYFTGRDAIADYKKQQAERAENERIEKEKEAERRRAKYEADYDLIPETTEETVVEEEASEDEEAPEEDDAPEESESDEA